MTGLEQHDKKAFQEVLAMIKEAREKVTKVINNELIDLYWNIGHFISSKSVKDGWGSGTVRNLSDFLIETEPN